MCGMCVCVCVCVCVWENDATNSSLQVLEIVGVKDIIRCVDGSLGTRHEHERTKAASHECA